MKRPLPKLRLRFDTLRALSLDVGAQHAGSRVGCTMTGNGAAGCHLEPR